MPHCSSTMIERYLTALHTLEATAEDPAAVRERLRDRFPRGATRRMTLLGTIVGANLQPLERREDDTLVYLSGYAETRALEGYLESFPSASPTLFQTSIHPSAVQQSLIGRQQPVDTFFPLTGSAHLVAQGLLTAALTPSPRALICGGEERGTWLLEQRAASDRTFAFAFALSASAEGALARVALAPQAQPDGAAATGLSLAKFFDALHQRAALAWNGPAGTHVSLQWL